MAKATITADEFATLPDAVQGLYAPDATNGGNSYRLQIEDEIGDTAPLRDALARERKARQQAEQDAKAMRKRYEAIEDPEAALAALDFKRKSEEEHLMSKGQFDELLAKRVEYINKEHANKEKSWAQAQENLQRERDNLMQRLEEVLIDTGLTQAAMKLKVRDTAVSDVLNRGRRVWKLQDGRPVPLREDGESVLYGKTPNQPMSMEEWVASLQSDAPHLFEPNRGAGVESGGGRGSAGGRITITREQARDVREWRRINDEAARTGAQVVIAD